MTTALVRQVTDSLAEFSSGSRLYELAIMDPSVGTGGMLVEAFAAIDSLQEVGWRDVIVLSTSIGLDAQTLLGQPAALDISLADCLASLASPHEGMDEDDALDSLLADLDLLH